MKNCAIYSSYSDIDQVLDIVTKTFKGFEINTNQDKTRIQITEKKLFGKVKNSFNIMTSRTENDKFSGMISGMHNFFSQIPAKNNGIKEKLLIKIETLHMVIGIVTDKDISDKFLSQLLSVTRELGGFMMWGGRQVLDDNGKLILDVDGNSEVEDFLVTAPSSFLDENLKITEDGLKRKERNEQILTERGIPFSRTLPVIVGEADVKLRSTEEIVKRAVALCICALKGECCGCNHSQEETKELVNRITNQYHARDFFTTNEMEFIDNDSPGESVYMKYSWCYEGFLVMLWALGFVDELDYPDHICDVPVVVRIMKEQGSYDNLLLNSRMRSKGEVLDAADYIYRLDWVCVDARIKNTLMPGGLDEGVVYERHRALNWVITYMDQDWDHVKTNT